jgi:hypothetical protein
MFKVLHGNMVLPSAITTETCHFRTYFQLEMLEAYHPKQT